MNRTNTALGSDATRVPVLHVAPCLENSAASALVAGAVLAAATFVASREHQNLRPLARARTRLARRGLLQLALPAAGVSTVIDYRALREA